MALSPDGARIYAAGTDGYVRVYSAETGQLVAEWDVGTRLGGIDLSPDGQILYVVERQPLEQYISPLHHEYWKSWAIVTFYEVNTTTGGVVSHPTRFTMSEDGFFDLAVQPDGKVLLSTSLLGDEAGITYPRLWLPETQRYIEVASTQNSNPVLSPNGNGSRVLFSDQINSHAETLIYSNKFMVAEHSFFGLGTADYFNRGVQAYSDNGKFAARHTDKSGLQVYDSLLNLAHDLTAHYGGRFKGSTTSGLAFDAGGRNLYVLDNATDAIVQISTSTWKIVQSIPVGVDFGLDPATAANGDYGNRLLVGPNARYFTVVTDARLRIVENPLASDTITGTAAAETVRGTGLADVVKGLDGNDLLLGGDGNDRLEGAAGGDRLVGGLGDDTLEAGAGYDKLFGGAGNDLLRGDVAGGTAGADGFHFDTAPSSTGNRDTIADFQPGKDRIFLDAAIFAEAGPAGPLAADAFRTIGVGAADAEDRIIYDRAAGILSYDPDGSGAAAAVQFARVTPGLALSSADFAVYGAPPAPPPPPEEPANHGVSPLATRYLGTHVSAGVVLSPDGSLVYAAGQDGFVRVFSAETGKLLKSWDVGTRLGGVDLSPDGRHLWVVEHKPLFQKEDIWDTSANRAKVTVYRVDAATGAVKSYPIVMTRAEDGFWDVAALADGTVLLSASILHLWSGRANLRLLDPATGSYTTLDLRPTWDAILTPGDSATRVLIGEMHTSGSYVRLYRDGEYLADHSNSPEFHSGLQAYNEQAKLVAQHTFTGGIYIFDDQLRLKINISDLHDGSFQHREIAGLAFDASGQYLFVLDNVTDSIIQIAVADGKVIRFIPVGVDFEEASGPLALDPLYGDRLLVGPDARYFTVVVGGRLRVVLNPFASDTIAGTDAADTLQGTGLADILQGLGGDDLLIGGKGNDRLEGGAGDDLYRADSGDTIIEAEGGGTDRVETASSHVLADFVDNLTLLGSADAAAAGNALANVLTGNAAANRLDGRGGADTMFGGAGNDLYVVDLAPADPAAARDLVVESAGDGTDKVESSVSYGLPDHVEHLTITGSAARNGAGNSLGNSLAGNNAANILSGRAGNDALRGAGGSDSLRGGAGDDRLYGGTGKDSLRGDTGADRFHFDTAPNADHRDKIEDFLPGTDLVALAASVFTQLGGPGALAADAFRTIGAGAADAEDRILYDPAIGAIYYDRDGSGGAAPILFATVMPGLALSSADFIVY